MAEKNRNKTLEAIDTKSVMIAYYIVFAMMIVSLLAVVAASIIIWALSKENTLMIALGFVVLIFGITLVVLSWFLTKVFIGMFYDIKIIRYHHDLLLEERRKKDKKEE